MIIVAEILLIALNILMAWWHSKILTRIKHGWWTLLFLSLVAACVLILRLKGFWDISLFILTALVGRKVFFSPALNLFRKDGEFGIFYVSPEIKRYKGYLDALRKGKFVDYVHYRLFGDRSEIYMFIYLFAFIILNILLCSRMLK